MRSLLKWPWKNPSHGHIETFSQPLISRVLKWKAPTSVFMIRSTYKTTLLATLNGYYTVFMSSHFYYQHHISFCLIT